MLASLDETLKLETYGAVKLPGERDSWTSLIAQLGTTADRLRANRRAETAEIDWKKLEQVLRDSGVEAGSRRYKEMLKRCREATERINQIVALQHEVEPWVPRPTPRLLEEVPSEFEHAVGPLAATLLRPILVAGAGPTVDRAQVAEGIDSAAKRGDRRGRYKLARVVDAWCADTGLAVPSLQDEMRRHRELEAALEELKVKSGAPSESIDEIELFVLEDSIDEAEEALQRLQQEISRRERAEVARRQLEGLRRKLLDSSLSEDTGWLERVADIESRLESDDPREMAREIGAAQTELSGQLDEMLQGQQEDLRQVAAPLKVLRATDSIVREWERKIDELERRGGRGANELKQGIEEELQRLRERCRFSVEENLGLVDTILTEEREDFSGEDLGYFANWHSGDCWLARRFEPE